MLTINLFSFRCRWRISARLFSPSTRLSSSPRYSSSSPFSYLLSCYTQCILYPRSHLLLPLGREGSGHVHPHRGGSHDALRLEGRQPRHPRRRRRQVRVISCHLSPLTSSSSVRNWSDGVVCRPVLGKAELFLWEMHNIPNVAERLNSLLYKTNFDTKCESLPFLCS